MPDARQEAYRKNSRARETSAASSSLGFAAVQAQWRAERAEMARMYLSGQSITDIATRFGVTHQAVSLRLKKEGIDAKSTAQERWAAASAASAVERRVAERQARLARLTPRYGVLSIEEYEGLMHSGLVKAYRAQRNNASQRGIEWKFTFASWHQAWRESGKLADRGRRREQWVMARFGDVGPYEPGNVYFCLHVDNVKHAAIYRRKVHSTKELQLLSQRLGCTIPPARTG